MEDLGIGMLSLSPLVACAVEYLVKPFGRDRLILTLDRVGVRLLGEA